MNTLKFKTTRRILALSIIVNMLLINYLQGQVETPKDTTRIMLSEVVITAGRMPMPTIWLPDAISSKDIDSKLFTTYRTNLEALIDEAGVFVQKTNHGGGSPFLRGLTGNQVLFLFDGIRLSNSTMRYGPNQLLNTVNMYGIERVELLHGGGSVEYGSDALGGSIQLFSVEQPFSNPNDFNGRLFTRMITGNMEQTVNGRLGFGNQKLALTTGATGRHFGDLTGGDTTGLQSPNAYDEVDFDIKLKAKAGKNSVLTFFFQRVHQSGVDVYHKVALENYSIHRMNPQLRNLIYVKLEQLLGDGFFNKLTITPSYQFSAEQRQIQKNGSRIFREERDEVATKGFIAELFTGKAIDWGSLRGNTGFEVYNDLVRSNRTDTDLSNGSVISKRGLYPDNSTNLSMGFFSSQSLELRRWVINAGLRFSFFKAEINETDLGNIVLNTNALVGNTGITFKSGNYSGIFLSVNSGFRAPNMDDLGTLGIVDFRYEVPNYDLSPQRSMQLQLGYRLRNKRSAIEVYAYQNRLNNLIVRSRLGNDSIEGYPVYLKENVEKAVIRGFEASLKQSIGKNISLKEISLTLTDKTSQNRNRFAEFRHCLEV